MYVPEALHSIVACLFQKLSTPPLHSVTSFDRTGSDHVSREGSDPHQDGGRARSAEPDGSTAAAGMQSVGLPLDIIRCV